MRFIFTIAILAIAPSLLAADAATPNVIVILADDMGIDSVSAFNEAMGLETPANWVGKPPYACSW